MAMFEPDEMEVNSGSSTDTVETVMPDLLAMQKAIIENGGFGQITITFKKGGVDEVGMYLSRKRRKGVKPYGLS